MLMTHDNNKDKGERMDANDLLTFITDPSLKYLGCFLIASFSISFISMNLLQFSQPGATTGFSHLGGIPPLIL